MKKKLTYSENCIVTRNQNEIRLLQEKMAMVVRKTSADIKALRKQNREILGRE